MKLVRRSPKTTVPLAAGILCGLLSGPALGQCPETDILTDVSNEPSDQCGLDVAISGDVAVVGCPRHNHGGKSDAGVAQVYRFDGTSWAFEQLLVAPDPAHSATFGWSVAVSGDAIAVGAPGKEDFGTDAGGVYAFRHDGVSWVFEQLLFSADLEERDHFGFSVDLDGAYMLIGAVEDDHAENVAGSAYVFYRESESTGWLEQQKLVHPSPGLSDGMGYSVALAGTLAVVGAPFDNEGGFLDSGSVLAFRRSGTSWALEGALLCDPGAQDFDWQGWSVATDGTTIVAGAPYRDRNGLLNAGVANTYELVDGNWVHDEHLPPPLEDSYDNFGNAVAVDGGTLIVAAHRANLRGDNSGVAYSFLEHAGSWYYDTKFLASSSEGGDQFGSSVAISGNRGVVGSVYADDQAPGAGAAFVIPVRDFFLSAEPPVVSSGENLTFTSYCGEPGSVILLAVVDVNGTPTFLPLFFLTFDSEHGLELTATVPPGLSGLSMGFQTYAEGAWSQTKQSTLATVTFN